MQLFAGFLFAFLLIACNISTAAPINEIKSAVRGLDTEYVPENISGMIIETNDQPAVLTSRAASRMARKTFSATPETAAGITRSRVGFMRVARAGVTVITPPGQSVEYTLKFRGKATFKGFKSVWVERAITEIARDSFQDFFREFENERKNLKTAARDNYYWFFQAASNFGYTKNDETTELINEEEFRELSKKTQQTLEKNERQELEAKVDGNFKVTSNGAGGRFEVSAFIRFNQIQLDSGEIINIARENNDLFFADQNNAIVGREESAIMVDAPMTTDDFLLDATLGN